MVNITFNIKKDKYSETHHLSPCQRQLDIFDRDLTVCNWERIYSPQSVDERVEHFNYIIVNLFNRIAPVKTVNLKRKLFPWITNNKMTPSNGIVHLVAK